MSSLAASTIAAELDPPIIELVPPRPTSPLILSSPHSGNVYPQSFLAASRLDARRLRKSEDCFVDELVSGAVGHGVPVLAARFPRAYLDVNREPYELDPGLFREPLPDYANTQSLRVVGGFGTLARVVSESEEIYRAPLKVADALARIDALYLPYHEALRRLIETTRRRVGSAILLDCHSMPSATGSNGRGGRADIVIGDRFGASADGKIVDALKTAFSAMGFECVMNRPYAGGFITEHYGRPALSVHAVQIEINRGLYMDEATLEKLPCFAEVRDRLVRALGEFAGSSSNQLQPPRLAAE
ncbi:MAG: N-formylglutamate amidohydrolase [Hyphomicrobiaceae bacterium]|nr:MAG: N-formylglutamate amidohydrolase [Hyphomicrobiaceae bacterium]